MLSLTQILKDLNADLGQTTKTNLQNLTKLFNLIQNIEKGKTYETKAHSVIETMDTKVKLYFQSMVFQMEMEQIAESIVRIKKRIAVNRIT